MVIDNVVSKWYGNERRAGNTTYSHPEKSHSSIIEESKFKLETHNLASYKYIWDIESIIGYIYSTSYGTKRFLGPYVKLFEKELKKELLKLNSNGKFQENINLSVKLALKSN